ncbi:zinc-finger domain-containing protein [Streptomyces sp. YPW6]|uniref:zinc-finger domain-containing protein n=1 Tax=Streptomyces sp. YPW6 TaxID=2840373 RepID=UPI003EB76289
MCRPDRWRRRFRPSRGLLCSVHLCVCAVRIPLHDAYVRACLVQSIVRPADSAREGRRFCNARVCVGKHLRRSGSAVTRNTHGGAGARESARPAAVPQVVTA